MHKYTVRMYKLALENQIKLVYYTIHALLLYKNKFG